MAGNEDLGEDSRVGGDSVHYRKKHHHNHHHAQKRTLPDAPWTNPNGNHVTNGGHAVEGMVGGEDLGEGVKVGGSAVNFARRHHHAQTQARTLPDAPYTNAGGNVATSGGD